ncbi:MAG: ComF family protein [Candidatus Levybacteria bacterium]|nr:ComF family protein [Candidatus Levybacteria bacterium]
MSSVNFFVTITLMMFLDFLFPKYCVNCRKIGDYICANCFSFISFDVEMICLVCNKGSFDGLTHPKCESKYAIDGAFSAVSYKGIVKKLIYNFKYKPFLADLKNTLNELFYESIIQNENFQKVLNHPPAGGPFLVPIPLHKRRLRTRGYNHSQLLAEGLSRKLNLGLLDILERTRDTKSQFGLNLKKRKENIKDAFTLNTKYPSASLRAGIIPNTIFLVDDILTTGSTLLEAARILKRSGVKKVWGLTLARD